MHRAPFRPGQNECSENIIKEEIVRHNMKNLPKGDNYVI